MVSTFQLTKLTRLRLAHQDLQDIEDYSARHQPGFLIVAHHSSENHCRSKNILDNRSLFSTVKSLEVIK